MQMIGLLHVPCEYYHLMGLGLERNFITRKDGKF